MDRVQQTATVALALAVALAGCGGSVDWNAPENLLLRESSREKDGRAELEYWSLLDAPCRPIYEAVADLEHWSEFIPGVDRAQLISQTPNTKTIQIAQRVIGRQNNAKVEWTLDPDKLKIDFRTLSSDLTYNDGSYLFEPSPNGKRCIVKTTFLVKEGKGLSLAALQQASRESFLAAARGVRKRVGERAGG
jgi:ribosome-associated toxin RatA of RatAB toxin-antitoxin module